MRHSAWRYDDAPLPTRPNRGTKTKLARHIIGLCHGICWHRRSGAFGIPPVRASARMTNNEGWYRTRQDGVRRARTEGEEQDRAWATVANKQTEGKVKATQSNTGSSSSSSYAAVAASVMTPEKAAGVAVSVAARSSCDVEHDFTHDMEKLGLRQEGGLDHNLEKMRKSDADGFFTGRPTSAECSGCGCLSSLQNWLIPCGTCKRYMSAGTPHWAEKKDS